MSLFTSFRSVFSRFHQLESATLFPVSHLSYDSFVQDIAGYDVRGNLRTLPCGDPIHEILSKRENRIDALEFVAADPMVTTPVPVVQPDDEDAVIIPARTGTLNVLKAAIANDIKRVVLTSSTAAVMSGNRDGGVFTDKDWTDQT
jgi:dihydroflavonol-4-reductase